MMVGIGYTLDNNAFCFAPFLHGGPVPTSGYFGRNHQCIGCFLHGVQITNMEFQHVAS
jgi:hypothetical protein